MDDKENKLFTDFRGSNILDGFDSSQMDKLKLASFITPENMDYFRDLLQVGWLSGQLSSSGPMPNSGEIVTTGALSSNATTTLKAPDNGEVWVVCALSGGKDFAGTANFQFFLEDASGNTAYLCDFNGTASNIPINEGGFVTPIYFDNKVSLKVNTSLISGSYGTITATALISRVR
jgi:hypothetical protein